MFVIFFYNDLLDAAKGEVNALYADDSKIFGVVKCARECEAVQSTLSNIDSYRSVVTTSNLTALNAKS